MSQNVFQLPWHLPMLHPVPAVCRRGRAGPAQSADAVVRASLEVHATARVRQKGLRFGLLTTLRCGCVQRVRVSWTWRAR
jgi:hypothetical protein